MKMLVYITIFKGCIVFGYMTIYLFYYLDFSNFPATNHATISVPITIFMVTEVLLYAVGIKHGVLHILGMCSTTALHPGLSGTTLDESMHTHTQQLYNR